MPQRFILHYCHCTLLKGRKKISFDWVFPNFDLISFSLKMNKGSCCINNRFNRLNRVACLKFQVDVLSELVALLCQFLMLPLTRDSCITSLTVKSCTPIIMSIPLDFLRFNRRLGVYKVTEQVILSDLLLIVIRLDRSESAVDFEIFLSRIQSVSKFGLRFLRRSQIL